MARTAVLAPVLIATLLAGCWSTDRPEVESTPVNTGPTAVPPPINLAGRWTLSSTGSSSCAMTFGAQAEATEGSIAPAGGCPFSFYTSRKWSYTTAGLNIRDHNGQVLVQLSPAGPDRFEGKTGAGQQIVLSR